MAASKRPPRLRFNNSGWLVNRIPRACVEACSHLGSCDEDVAFWAKRLDLETTLTPLRPLVERYLRDFGAWDDLTTADMTTLTHRVLWVACCDVKEYGEWLGLVH